MKKLTLAFVLTLGVAGMTSVPAFAQDKMSDGKMGSSKMDMSKMSDDDKAAMFDKMSEPDKMQACKMAGHDMGKMSSSEKMDMMAKMTVAEKAAAFDKMPESKRTAMMKKASGDKMKMDKDKMKMDKKM